MSGPQLAALRPSSADRTAAIQLRRGPNLSASYTVAGPEETHGPLGDQFDEFIEDYRLGQTTFEQAERELTVRAVHGLLRRAGLAAHEVDLFLAGDLLNQLVTVNFAARELRIPVIGLYSACASLAESLAVGALLVDGGHVRRVVCAVASHFYTAERQYRYPTELGNQRVPESQRTATGAAAFLLEAPQTGDSASDEERVAITSVTLGRVTDLGVADPNNMGAAEAPAAADTLQRHLGAVHRSQPYDRVLTGDLSAVGLPLARELLAKQNIVLGETWQDCGLLLYDQDRQAVQAGGSGAACSGLVLGARDLMDLHRGSIRDLLFVGTGALHSPVTYQQGESIPGIAHAIAFERRAGVAVE